MNEHMVSKLLFLRKLFSHHWNSIYFWPADVFSSYIRAFQMVLILGNSCNLNKKDFNSFMSFLQRKPPFSCLQARTISYYSLVCGKILVTTWPCVPLRNASNTVSLIFYLPCLDIVRIWLSLIPWSTNKVACDFRALSSRWHP